MAPRPPNPISNIIQAAGSGAPATAENRAFVRRTLEALVARGPVVSLATGLRLDDHDGDDLRALGVQPLPSQLHPRDNLALQSALVAGAAGFAGTYGGFSYLAPFFGVPSTAYYSNVHGFSARHLVMARSAIGAVAGSGPLDVRSTGGERAAH